MQEVPDLPIAVASVDAASIARQLIALGCASIWYALDCDPVPFATSLKLDPASWEMMDTLLVFPARAVLGVEARILLKWFDYRFRGARTRRLSAPPLLVPHYSTLIEERSVAPFDLESAVERYHGIVFARAQDELDDWAWCPLGKAVLERRIYAMQPWAQIRCTNRLVDTLDFPNLNAHIFFRATAHDTIGTRAFSPTGFLARDSTLGPVDTNGHRISVDKEALKGRERNHVVISALGGSAVWGQGCLPGETIPDRLEVHLNARYSEQSRLRFTVLNYGIPASTTFNDAVTFLAYVESLRPDFVIDHGGFNDCFFGQFDDPAALASMGIVYVNCFEAWAHTIHAHPDPASVCHRAPAPHAIVDAYLARRSQLSRLVNGMGSQFIYGLQPYFDSRRKHPPVEICYQRSQNYRSPQYRNIAKLYQLIQASSPLAGVPFVDFHECFGRINDDAHLFTDIVHLTPEGNDRIAKTYADVIVDLLVRSSPISATN
jgi:lysophospholipase L1-like esterase